MARKDPIGALLTVGGLAVAGVFAYRSGILTPLLAPLTGKGGPSLPVAGPGPAPASQAAPTGTAGNTQRIYDPPAGAGYAVPVMLDYGNIDNAPNAVPWGPAAGASIGGSATYTIKPGDTLGEIAQRYRTTVAALASANGIANPDLIYPGNTLTIPVA